MAKAKTDEKVMAMVEEELKKNPDVSVDELQQKGTAINNEVSSLTARQFHARYPLQVKRRMAMSGGTSAPRKKPAKKKKRKKAGRRGGRRQAAKAAPAASASGVNREAVRAALLRFATDLVAAEERKDLVKVLASVDKYVDGVAKAAGS